MESKSASIKRLEDDTVHLIVNADDYRYFDGISRGILQAHREGLVSATGVLADSEDFERHFEWLGKAPDLDVGVHLNLTYGVSLTRAYRGKLTGIGGEFSSAAALLWSLLRRSIGLREIEIEWKAQIRRCIEAGLRPWLLNSHERVHVLPPLSRIVLQFASERSGKLDRRYFETMLPNLIPAECYELMYHPGIGGSHEHRSARPLDYHDWDLEHGA